MKITERYGTVLRCYDNGGKTADRYTILPPRWAHHLREEQNRNLFVAIGCNASPFHPQGVGYTTSAMPGPHLGKRVAWSALPEDVQLFARSVFPYQAPKVHK